MKDFTKDILHTIEHEKIAPRPRWIFLARQCALLGGFFLSVLIGGVSVSVILFSLTDIDEGAARMMRMHPGPFLITYLPYAWVLTLIAFGIVAYYDMRNIKGAYRYRAITILSASIVASIVVGGMLHVVGMGKIAERRFAQVIPHYRGFDARKEDLWMRPGEGTLAGTIISGSATTTFVLEDFAGMRWAVDAEGAVHHGVIGDGSFVRVKVIGSVVRPGIFHATDVFPWMRGGPRPSGDGSRQGPSALRQAQDKASLGQDMMQGMRSLQAFPDEARQEGMLVRERISSPASY